MAQNFDLENTGQEVQSRINQVPQNENDITALEEQVGSIEGKIPAEASPENKLADKDYVDAADAAIQANIFQPDNVDIDATDAKKLQFKDNVYNRIMPNGMGRIYLRPNPRISPEYFAFDGFVDGVTDSGALATAPDAIYWDRTAEKFVGKKSDNYYTSWLNDDKYVPVSTNTHYLTGTTPYIWDGTQFILDDEPLPELKNILTQDMLTYENTIYVIRDDFDLNNGTITIPANCVLEFDGGSLSNGFINMQGLAGLDAPLYVTVFENIEIIGGFKNPMTLHTSWFGIKDGVDCDDMIEHLMNCTHIGNHTSVYTELIFDTDITLYRPIEARLYRSLIKGISNSEERNNHKSVTIKSDYQPSNVGESLIKITGVAFHIVDLGFLWNITQDGQNNILELIPNNYGHGDEATVDLDATITNCWFRTFWDTVMIKATGRGLLVTNCIFSNSHRDNYGQRGDIECYSTYQNLNDRNGSYLEDQLRAIIIKDNRFHSGPGYYALCLRKGDETVTSPFKGVQFTGNYCDRGNGFIRAYEDVQGMIVTNNTSLFRRHNGGLVRLASFKGVIFANNDIQASGRETDTEAVSRACITIQPNENTQQFESLVVSNNHFYRMVQSGIVYCVSNNGESFPVPLSSVTVQGNSFINCFDSSTENNGIVFCEKEININNLCVQGNVTYGCASTVFGLYIYSTDSNTTECRNILIENNLGITNSFKVVTTINPQKNNPQKYINVLVEDLPFTYNGSEYVEYDGAPHDILRNGHINNIPNGVYVGFKFFAENIGRPLWYARETSSYYYWNDADGNLISVNKETNIATIPNIIGENNDRPSGDYVGLGFTFYNTTTKRFEILTQKIPTKVWREPDGALARVPRSGVFEHKPSSANIYVGFKYFCTDRQTTEGATDGIEIIYKGQENNQDVWVDALGRVVE